MRAVVTLACLVPAGVRAAPGDAAPEPNPIRLVNHRAVYDLTLAGSTGPRAIEGVRGRIVVDFAGDACKGYTTQTRQVTILTSGESGDKSSDLRSTSVEAGDGHSLKFRSETIFNGRPTQTVDGTAEIGVDGLRVRLRDPKGAVAEAGPVVFPAHQMLGLIHAARSGETTLAIKLFDGSDDGRKVYETLALIGPAAPARTAPAEGGADAGNAPVRDKPLSQGAMVATRRWPVTLSYFTPGAGERVPVYTLSFDLYENGVSGALKLDYGEFAIQGNLAQLDLAKDAPKVEGECGR